eukprot:TRINITY_DN38940_c0_g1_i1.p1 TRINITY_DN38940_c0_g1~~TRINITY_DN38940_c0_g1_i1.p1  ORF type:complete len:463 (+),score=124.19 TRINITY_DN38940_c0_g1_i1:63-1451(+)
MSWRAESNFVASSKLRDEEKNFLKLAKKIRDIWKLEERVKAGEEVDAKQREKVDSLPESIKELIGLVAKLPDGSEVLDKNPDMADLIPNSAKREAEKRRQQEQQRKQRREEEERKKRDTVVMQDRHTRPITDISVSADGKRIFTSSKDKIVLCWSTARKLLEATHTYGGHEGAVFAVDVSPSAPARLATGAADGTLKLWPAEASGKSGIVAADSTVQHGGIVKVLRWCPFEPTRLATASDKLGAQQPMIAVWKVNAPGKGAECLVKMEALPTKANALQWGSGGKPKVFSAHDNGYIGVWDATDGKLLKTLKLHREPIIGLAMDPAGVTLLTASRDMTGKAVDISTRDTPEIRTWKTDRPLNAVAVSPQFSLADERGSIVFGGGRQDRDIATTKEVVEGEMDPQILSTTGEWQGAGKGHIGPIHVIRFIAGGGFATGAEDGCIYVHDMQGGLLHSDNMRDGSR